MCDNFQQSAIAEHLQQVTECAWTSVDFALAQCYVVLLLVMLLIFAIRHRNVKRNYKVHFGPQYIT